MDFDQTPYDLRENDRYDKPLWNDSKRGYLDDQRSGAYDRDYLNSYGDLGYGRSERIRNDGGDFGYAREGRNGREGRRGGSRGDRDRNTCPIQTKETRSSHIDLPTTSSSAIVSTPTGDYILYCSQSPPRTILAYQLYCGGSGEDGIGKEAVHSVIDRSCSDIRVVDDLTNLLKPKHLVVVLANGEHSAAYRVDYDSNVIKLLPCSHIFEFKYLTDLETVGLGDAGTLLAFANNNVDLTAEYHETLAPIYIAKHGEIALCGYAEVKRTWDVTSWRRGLRDEIILIYSARVGHSRRSVLYYFELRFMHGRCHVKPWRHQKSTGAAPYNGHRNTLCASQPFTIDQCLCGVEDLKILTTPNRYRSVHLGVALANHNEDENAASCPLEEQLTPNNANEKSFCCCSRANERTFIIEYSPYSKNFDFLRHKETAFQELYGRQKSVTELSQLQTEKCCPIFQTVSPLGETELYTLEYNSHRELQVYTFVNHGLPHYAESSSYGYCDDNDLIVSYTLHSFQSDNTIYHIKCNQEGHGGKGDSYRQRVNREKYIRYPQQDNPYMNHNQSRIYNRTQVANYNRTPYTNGLSNDLLPNRVRVSGAEYPDQNDYNNSISYDQSQPYQQSSPSRYGNGNPPYYPQIAQSYLSYLPQPPHQSPPLAYQGSGNGAQNTGYGTTYHNPYQAPNPGYLV
jgi:hypothetical protein